MRLALPVLATLLSVLGNLWGVRSHEQVVVPLHDGNFEDATQAASGQTTGFWLVYFGKEEDVSDQKYWETFAEQQREEHPWLLHAHVNIDQSTKLAERFSIVNTPAFILFRNRKMYRFSNYVKAINPETISALEAFVGGGWRDVRKEEVPKDKFSLGISKTTLGLIIGGAALSSILVAAAGEWYGRYIEKNRPVASKPTKGQ